MYQTVHFRAAQTSWKDPRTKVTVATVGEFKVELARLAEEFSIDAAEVDRASLLPIDHLDALAKLGLYGAFAPVAEGGLGMELPELCGVVEELAVGCLASTFVWIQHFRLLAAVLFDEATATLAALRTKVIRGELKGGVALSGLLPGPPRLTATPTAGGWILNGDAPWVSGWGLIDELFVAARGPDDTVVNLLVTPDEQPGLLVIRHQLAAINATATVGLSFESLAVDRDRFVSQVALDPGQESGVGLRLNGSLALGVTRRCCSLIGESSLDDELRDARADLDAADVETMPKARARASALAARAASTLCVHRGSSSVLSGDVAERTSREATLLLTFGSRPAIRASLFDQLASTP
ncbi:MAG: acyl-CoA dehydrogenase family protein [Acidimicrobiales bacterium]